MNCPYCVGKKAGKDNHLGITHPHLVAQFHPTLNTLKMTELRPGSLKKVWWICKNSHVWEAAIASRTRLRATGCPECSPTPRTSAIEAQIREAIRTEKLLSDIPETYNAFVLTNGGKREAVDIYGQVCGVKVVIEYDSWWWHSGASRNTPYDEHAVRDTRKTWALLEAGYVVIRIREITHTKTLPFLELDNPHLHQIGWKQSEGLDVLLARIKSCTTTQTLVQ